MLLNFSISHYWKIPWKSCLISPLSTVASHPFLNPYQLGFCAHVSTETILKDIDSESYVISAGMIGNSCLDPLLRHARLMAYKNPCSANFQSFKSLFQSPLIMLLSYLWLCTTSLVYLHSVSVNLIYYYSSKFHLTRMILHSYICSSNISSLVQIHIFISI